MSTLRMRDVARCWRWGRRPLVPSSAEPYRLPEEPGGQFDTRWARTPAAVAVRSAVLEAGMKPLLWSQTSPRVTGLDVLAGLRPPVLFVANHSSHLDAPLILCALPPSWRRATLVTAAADYFFDAWWRATGTALAFGTVPLDRTGRAGAMLPDDLLHEGWNLLVFPEGTRSPDGQPGLYRSGAARLAMSAGVPIVPIGLSGSFAAMPRGRGWPVPGRPRVAVRFGAPLRPRQGESAKQLTDRIGGAVQRLVDEDRVGWYASLRTSTPAARPGTQAARWRRVWAATEPAPSDGPRTPWD